MKSDSPKKSRHSKMKKKNNSSDDDSEEEVVYMEGWESDEEELPKSGTADFAKMFQQLGRKYKAKKDDEEAKCRVLDAFATQYKIKVEGNKYEIFISKPNVN